MEKLKGLLSGRKTHLVGAGLIGLGVAVIAGWAQPSEAELQGIVALLGGLGLAALRAGVSKLGGEAAEKALAALEAKAAPKP